MNNVLKKERTSKQNFDNEVINIRMPEINSMIYLKTSFDCPRQQMGNSPKITEGANKIVRHSESLKQRVRDTKRIYKEPHENAEGTK